MGKWVNGPGGGGALSASRRALNTVAVGNFLPWYKICDHVASYGTDTNPGMFSRYKLIGQSNETHYYQL